MFFKSFATFLLASLAFCSAALTADANPRFTVHNDIGIKIEVYIYNGDDYYCEYEDKIKTVPGGKSRTFGCNGNGKGRCKIRLKMDNRKICKPNRDTCFGKTKKINGGGEVKVLVEDDEVVCEYTD